MNGSIGSQSYYTEDSTELLYERALEQPDSIPAFADYMSLLGAGLPVIATGNSDSHRPNNGVGYPRNF